MRGDEKPDDRNYPQRLDTDAILYHSVVVPSFLDSVNTFRIDGQGADQVWSVESLLALLDVRP